MCCHFRICDILLLRYYITLFFNLKKLIFPFKFRAIKNIIFWQQCVNYVFGYVCYYFDRTVRSTFAGNFAAKEYDSQIKLSMICRF
jgi:hypothetical protein